MRNSVSFILIVFATSFCVSFCYYNRASFFKIKTCSLKHFAQSVFILAGNTTFSVVFIFVCTLSHVYDTF